MAIIRIVELFSDSLKCLCSLLVYFIMFTKEKTMSEITHKIDANFAGRLNILRAGVLGANDGIISIAGVVIGVASATTNIWIIFLSGLAAILAGAFSMAGGEYVSVSTQKDTEEAAVAVNNYFWIKIWMLLKNHSTQPIFKMVSVKHQPNS